MKQEVHDRSAGDVSTFKEMYSALEKVTIVVEEAKIDVHKIYSGDQESPPFFYTGMVRASDKTLSPQDKLTQILNEIDKLL